MEVVVFAWVNAESWILFLLQCISTTPGSRCGLLLVQETTRVDSLVYRLVKGAKAE
jgi:hypothetical protein